jgi:hypothetical protein
MRFLLFHSLVGIFTGARFRIHTLTLVAALTALEAAWVSRAGSLAAAVAWVFVAEVSLQIGYIAGVGIRCAMEYVHPELRYYLKPTGTTVRTTGRFRGG